MAEESAYKVAASGIKAVFDTTFAPEGVTAQHDCLHESLGHGRVVAGISPIRKGFLPNNQSVQYTDILIQFYDLWRKEVDPTLQVNPFKITSYAERLERALEAAVASAQGTSGVWYYQVTGVDFPRDPTSNKSRFEMTVRATGDAPGLETRA